MITCKTLTNKLEANCLERILSLCVSPVVSGPTCFLLTSFPWGAPQSFLLTVSPLAK